MTAEARAGPFTVASLAPARWAFGLRVWLAMMLALYVAFWLELDGAASAATGVAILALPTRGQAYEKALYRLAATGVGVAASIAISGLFAQARDLFIVAYAGWLGLCVFGAGLLDGNRAYGVVLSGYTVAIVAVMQIDSPGNVFLSGINRGAAIAVGIAAVAVVNDLFAAPDLYPKILRDLTSARSRVSDFARGALRSGVVDSTDTVEVLKRLTALHPGIDALATESSQGRIRSAAARATVLALVEEVMAVRALLRLRHGRHEAADLLETALGRDEHDGATQPASSDDPEMVRTAILVEQDHMAVSALANFQAQRRPAQVVRLPLFRSRRHAVRKGFGVGAAVALSSILFVYSSWPSTSVALSLLGIVAALGANTPNIKGFSLGALIAMPAAVAVAGITEFVVLDGVDQFPLLCIALAPPVIGASLLVTSANPKLGGIGSLMLVFVPVILSPSNPQSYNPQSYLVVGLLAITAVLLLALWLMVLVPASDAQRRRWLLRSAADDLRRARDGRPGGLSPAEAAYRTADRIGQLAALGPAADPDRRLSIEDALLLADLDGALRRAGKELALLAGSRNGRACAEAGTVALRRLAPGPLRAAAESCRRDCGRLSGAEHVAAGRAAAELSLAADIVHNHRAALRRLAPDAIPA